jgi:hypothetical protein
MLRDASSQNSASSNDLETKRFYGQFFTTTNPFANDLFLKWADVAAIGPRTTIIEPFAGANNIVSMIREFPRFSRIGWDCYDIDPVNDEDNATFNGTKILYPVSQRDTLRDMPAGRVAITNPPYLAKNSASRRGLPYPETPYDDLYKLAIDRMLDRIGYVAAIIPESFLTAELFHNRLYGAVSLNCRMFEDTEVPVCLALFIPTEKKKDADDFLIYRDSRRVGTYHSLKKHLIPAGDEAAWVFNDREGTIGLRGIDNQQGASIEFIPGSQIDPGSIKHSSRALTRIAGCPRGFEKRVINIANTILKERRAATKDVFMTSFKGLRADGYYRRRLDFRQARDILNHALAQVRGL